MNKERFHNALAMALGYERIVNDKRYNIIVDDKADNPRVIIKDVDGCELISFMADEAGEIRKSRHDKKINLDRDKDINLFLDIVHQAYIQATMRSF